MARSSGLTAALPHEILCVKHYDNIVVGSGASGLSLAHLLALNGKKVLLIEKGWYLGGSMTRFVKKGIPFDVGFHFTAGFNPGGILDEMLITLGIRNEIEPIFLEKPEAGRYVFESDHKSYDIPSGIENFKNTLINYFPAEAKGIEQYFELSGKCYRETLSLNLRRLGEVQQFLEEDRKTLSAVLDANIKDDHLKAILSTFCMCYGTPPSEVSFANHCRVAHGLHDALARVKDGGDAFVRSFTKAIKNLGVEIRMRTYITECKNIENRTVGSFVLNTGEEVSCDQCIFTIHPSAILKILPAEHVSKAFVERVNDFEPTLGFFSLYCTLKTDNPEEPLTPAITSIFPYPDVDKAMSPAHSDQTTVVVLTSNEEVKGKHYKLVTALETSFYKDVEEWKDTTLKKRPAAYLAYKKNRCEKIIKRITDFYPEYKDRLEVIEAASMLSYRDFLHTPDGSAYGIKQKIGQVNLFGKLPFRNLYVAGQSSVLPGIVGAMMSSFIILRSLIGPDNYDKFIKERLPG